MKRTLTVLLALALTLSFAACAAPSQNQAADASKEAPKEEAAQSAAEQPASNDDQIVIGLTCANMANEHNVLFVEAAKAYAEKLGNVSLVITDGAGLAEKQVEQCETFVTQKVDAVILNPYDAEGCIPAAQVCINAGIPVFTAKAQISDQSIVPTYVGSDDFNAGQIEMTFMAELLGGKGNIVIIEGPTGISAALLRNDGINDILKKYPDIKVVYTQPADWHRDKAMGLMENWLQLGTKIDGVVAHNDEMALGAYDALLAAGLQDEIPVIGIDAIDAALESVKAGNMAATVLQDAVGIGEKTVEVAVMLAKGEPVEKLYDIPFVLVKPEDVDKYMK